MADINDKNSNIDSGNTDINSSEDVQKDTSAKDSENGTQTVEELMAQLASANATIAKQKNTIDKTLKEKGEITKKYRETLSVQQQQEMAQKEAQEEHERYVKGLEDFQKKSMAKDRYLTQGMDVSMATKAAELDVSGDMDALSELQKQFTEAVVKARETEWKKSRPDPQSGVGNDSITQEQFDKMSLSDKTKLFRTNRAEYDRLMGKK